MNNTWVKRLVAFAVLMESGDGVLSKDPKYIREKWQLCSTYHENRLPQLMDMQNRAKYKAYLREWLKKGEVRRT